MEKPNHQSIAIDFIRSEILPQVDEQFSKWMDNQHPEMAWPDRDDVYKAVAKIMHECDL